MNIYLYVSSAETNEFPKVLPEPTILTGALRDSCSILDPVIRLTGFNPSAQYNYCYIPDFGRYYFITSADVIRTGVIDYTMHVDVLNSWAAALYEQEAVIARNEYEFNKWAIDDRVPIYDNTTYEFVPAKTSFSPNYTPGIGINNFIVAIAGTAAV